MRITDIEKSNVNVLERAELASIYGGPLAVDQDAQGRLKPHDSLYKITFKPDAPLNLEQNPYMLRGNVRLEAEHKSYISSWIRSINALFIREMNF